MRPFWLIESDAYGASIEPLKTEIARQGMSFGIVHHESFTSGYETQVGNHVLQDDDCIILIGTWPLWRHIQLHHSGWTPGGWCATENLDCAVYYPRLRGFLLNEHCAMMTGIEAITRRDELFTTFGQGGFVFARPTGCLKVFVGRCIDAASFQSALAPTRYDPLTRVVIAAPRPLEREWRFVIAEQRPIAASEYLDGGVKSRKRGCPVEVWQFVEHLLRATAWAPDDVFIMDVCESAGKLQVVELNGFSCAGLYDCDLVPVVAEAARIAERSWQQKYGSKS